MENVIYCLKRKTLYRKTIKKQEWWVHEYKDNDDGYHYIICSIWGLGLSSFFNAIAKHSPGTRKCSTNVSEWVNDGLCYTAVLTLVNTVKACKNCKEGFKVKQV